jgi:hypothetical protein
MNKSRLEDKKVMRTKLFNELADYLETNLPEGSYSQQGNIPQVLQWGNLAKIIFCYLINPQIRNKEMNDKVALLKDLSLQISIEKNTNIQQKINDNFGFIRYQRDIELILKSLEMKQPFITKDEIVSLIDEIKENSRLTRIVNKKKRETNPIDIIKLLKITAEDEMFDVKENLLIRTYNIIAADNTLNSLKPIEKQKMMYRDFIKNEKNPLIKKIIKEHEVIR